MDRAKTLLTLITLFGSCSSKLNGDMLPSQSRIWPEFDKILSCKSRPFIIKSPPVILNSQLFTIKLQPVVIVKSQPVIIYFDRS